MKENEIIKLSHHYGETKSISIPFRILKVDSEKIELEPLTDYKLVSLNNFGVFKIKLEDFDEFKKERE